MTATDQTRHGMLMAWDVGTEIGLKCYAVTGWQDCLTRDKREHCWRRETTGGGARLQSAILLPWAHGEWVTVQTQSNRLAGVLFLITAASV